MSLKNKMQEIAAAASIGGFSPAARNRAKLLDKQNSPQPFSIWSSN